MRMTVAVVRWGGEGDLVDFEQGGGGGEQHDGVQRDERDDVDERLGELGRREVEHDDGDEAARQHQDAGEEAAMRLLQDLRSVLTALLRYTTHNTNPVNVTISRPGGLLTNMEMALLSLCPLSNTNSSLIFM